MTLQAFLSNQGKPQPLSFYVLDEPFAVRTTGFADCMIFALANTKWVNEGSYEVQYTFALAALASTKQIGKPQIVALRIGPHQGLSEEDVMEPRAWTFSLKFWFYSWIKSWVAENPEEILRAGVAIGKAEAKKQ